jgi:hypothetical protein
MTNLPSSHDRMPIESRKPRAGPLLEPDEVIAMALNGVALQMVAHPQIRASLVGDLGAGQGGQGRAAACRIQDRADGAGGLSMKEGNEMDHRVSETASAVIGHQEPPMLDLQPFCSTDTDRYYLMKPFSRAGFTWATNGHILVRVQLRADVPDIDKKFNQAKPLEGFESTTFIIPEFSLPPAPTSTGICYRCEGRGLLHDCPDCDCECRDCGGAGDVDAEKLTSTMLGPKTFALNYVRMMLSLPGIEIAASPSEPDEKPLFFRFDGGIGALMPMGGSKENHIDVGLGNY